MRMVSYDAHGNVIEDVGEWEPLVPPPMLPHEVVAVLNVVLGLWSLQDAANAIGRHPDDLVAEAQAWAVAGGNP